MSSATTSRIGRVARPLGALTLAAWGALLAAGCAATTTRTPLAQARMAEREQDWDRAVVSYTNALRERPGDQALRLSLERAKIRATDAHVTRARRLASLGRLEEALVEYQVAQQLSPASTPLDDAIRDTRAKLRARVPVTREGKTQLQSLIERARDLPPPGLDLPANVELPESLVFRQAGSRDVFTAIGRLADVSLVFDPAFRDAPITIDFKKSTFAEALTSLTASTQTFFRVTAPRTIVIVPDTQAKRREYEEEVIRTFYLSNVDVKETIDLLRIVVDARRLAPVAGTNAITLKDTPERVAAAGRIIAAVDKARAEVVIDVEVLEVDRTQLREFGLQVATVGSSGIEGGLAVNRETLTLRDLRTLTTGDITLAGFPALFYRLLKSDSSSRTLANPQLRSQDGVAAQARFGERVPVPSTTFTPIATGGVSQQPVTSFTYENIGVNIDITPRIHHNDDVSLALKVEVSNISGTGYGDLPTFGNRSVSTLIRLKDGETSVLAGLIRDDERTVLDGVPGLSDLPIVGRLFAKNHREKQETDIILTLTPHIVRVLDLTEADLRPFRVGRDIGSPIDLPAISLPPDEEPAASLPVPVKK